MKQMKVPEYREGAHMGGYLRTLVLFLKDFSMAAWTADRQRKREIAALEGELRALRAAMEQQGTNG